MRVVNRLAVASALGFAAYALSYCPSSFGQAVSATPTPVPDGKEVKNVVATPKPPEPRFKLYGWIEGGITGNPDSPIDNHNFGHLFTDRANEPLLNQVSIVGERALERGIGAGRRQRRGREIHVFLQQTLVHRVVLPDLSVDGQVQAK